MLTVFVLLLMIISVDTYCRRFMYPDLFSFLLSNAFLFLYLYIIFIALGFILQLFFLKITNKFKKIKAIIYILLTSILFPFVIIHLHLKGVFNYIVPLRIVTAVYVSFFFIFTIIAVLKYKLILSHSTPMVLPFLKKAAVAISLIVLCIFLFNWNKASESIIFKHHQRITFPYYYIKNRSLFKDILVAMLKPELRYHSFTKRKSDIIVSNKAPQKTSFSPQEAHLESQEDINVVLIFADAVRPNHIGCYGYHRGVSPNIDSLAKKGLMFKNMFVQSTWTKTSTASFFTSLYPFNHMAMDRGDFLSDDILTLPEMLKSHGYKTFGATANYSAGKGGNLQQGFDSFYFYKKASQITSKAKEWLDNNYKEKFFMYLFFLEPHPYDCSLPEEEYLEAVSLPEIDKATHRDKFLDIYDHKIAYMDNHIGEVIDALKEKGVYGKTLIIFTSDHGEEYFEHANDGHGHSLYNEVLSVPLIITLGDKFEGTRDEYVRAIDLGPTVLDVLGIQNEWDVDGKSFFTLLQDDTHQNYMEPEYIYSEIELSVGLRATIKSFIASYAAYNKQMSIQNRHYKYIKSEHNGLEELYNLSDDPKERKNIIDHKKNIAAIMEQKIKDLRSSKRYEYKKEDVLIDKEYLEQLKSLGYL